jgi:hypothetical protein
MELNFDPKIIKNANNKFIWITIQYILRIIKIMNKNPDNIILLDVLKMNMNTLKEKISNYDKLLDNILELENFINHIDGFTQIFLQMIKKIPIDIDYDELIC